MLSCSARVLRGIAITEHLLNLFHTYPAEECDHIISMSKSRMERSGVVETETGGSEISEIRTSSGVFLDRGEDDVVKAIEERISQWTLMPVGNGEGLQVLKYDPSQKYDAHWDYL